MTEPDKLATALRGGIPEVPVPELDPEAAAAAGLLDVAYATLDSPVGRLLVAASPRGLVRVAYLDKVEDEDLALDDLAARVSPRVLAAPRRLDGPRRELDEYFAGRRDHFETVLDWQLTRGFGRRVLQATAAIPFGSVSSYRDVAAAAGSPRGARGRERARFQPDANRRSVPPDPPQRWRDRRVHGRVGAQAGAAEHRGPTGARSVIDLTLGSGGGGTFEYPVMRERGSVR